jgi:hypothetical protein
VYLHVAKPVIRPGQDLRRDQRFTLCRRADFNR